MTTHYSCVLRNDKRTARELFWSSNIFLEKNIKYSLAYLEISVNDAPLMTVLHGGEDLPELTARCLLSHAAVPCDVICTQNSL